jgi:hypothetical protein
MVDVLYPPPALLLFVPFVWLPWPLWWLIPAAVLLHVVRWLSPAPWSWPLLALLVLWPRTLGAILWGNTDLWVAAGLAAGIRWGWPAALLVLKPTFALLAVPLLGDRRLWAGAAVLAAASAPLLGLWVDYVEAMRNLRIGWDYSLPGLPLVVLPLVAAAAGQVERARVVSPDSVPHIAHPLRAISARLRAGARIATGSPALVVAEPLTTGVREVAHRALDGSGSTARRSGGADH